MPTLRKIHPQPPQPDLSFRQHFTPIQSKRFRTPLPPCWSLCPSMDLLALGSGSVVVETSPSTKPLVAADAVTIYRIVSWQRLLSLTVRELTSHQEEEEEGRWSLVEDGCGDNTCWCNEEERHGATSITWSPDGRLVAIGLQDGGVLIHGVEASKDEEGEETMMIRPLHVIRTAFHATVSTGNETEKTELKKSIAFSPRVTRSMARKERKDDDDTTTFNPIQQEAITTTTTTTTHSSEQQTKATSILGLTWKRIAPQHSSWSITNEERERRETWKYTSQFISRGNQFLPPPCHADKTQTNLFSPLAHLNVLLVATQNELHWYLQSRYRIMTKALHFPSSSSIRSVNVVCSPDMTTVFCTAEYAMGNKKVCSSYVKILSCPLMATKRFDLQILAASYRSIFTRLRNVKDGIQSALTLWTSALRPLDTKFQRLFQLFRNYNVVTTAMEANSASHSIREELLRFILSGRSTVVGDASNALDQFFTRADMHDQLLLREANGIKASAGSMESKLRSDVQSQIRAIVYETEELYGLIKTYQVTAVESVLVEADVALRLYTSSRMLYLTFERFIAHVVEARSRLNDFLAWMRGTATEIRARGTAADSIMRQHARDRRCPHGVVCRVTDFLSGPMMSPYSCVTSPKLGHRKLTECIIGVPLSDYLSADCNTEGVSDQEPTLNSALFQTFHITAALFEQPRNVFSQSLCELDITFEVQHSLIALHTRIGASSDATSGEGYFSPQINNNDFSLSSEYWVIIARTIPLFSYCNVLEITAIPCCVFDCVDGSGVESQFTCLQVHLRFDSSCEITSIAFYSDDGNSSLSPNLDIDAEAMEGKQSIGLIVKNGMNEELWKFQYDDVLFDTCISSIASNTLCIPSNINGDNCTFLGAADGEEDATDLKKRVICTQENNTSPKSHIVMCGSRGTGGVLTFGATNGLDIFDLEEDEDSNDEDDDSDVIIDDVD